MTTKQLFQSKSTAELRTWWQQVVANDKFEQVLLYARSHFLDGNPTEDQLRGAKRFELCLSTLGEADDYGPDTLGQIAEAARLAPVEPLLTRKRKE